MFGAHPVCAEFAERLDGCVSNRELFDLAGDIQAAYFLVQSVSEGWGPDASYIRDRFSHYLNGRYVSSHVTRGGNGYTSAVYCGYEGEVEAEQDVYVLIGCGMRLRVRPGTVCRVFADAATRLSVTAGQGSVVTVTSWNEGNVVSDGKGRTRVDYERV